MTTIKDFTWDLKYVVIGGVILALVLMAITGAGFQIVNTGSRGVMTRFGKVISDSLPEGIYFFNPLTTSLIEMDVREQKLEYKTLAYTKDVQNVDVYVVLNYHPEAAKMHILYSTVGVDWAEKILQQVVFGKVKEVIGHYEAVQLVSNRAQATKEMFDRISADLAGKNVIIKNFEMTNMDFNDQFEHAVESKVVAIQQAEESKNKTVKVREEADQKIISAKAEAESMRIRSQALSQNKGLVDYEAVQKWDGKLPETMMGSSVPFLNLQKK